MTRALIALGSNLSGKWGSPHATLEEALRRLEAAGVRPLRRSRWYCTAPVGPMPQPAYLNGITLIDAPLAPAALLRLLHRVEREAGRRVGPRWGPRPLDLDLIDCAGRRIGWTPRRAGKVLHPGTRPASLALPHPALHRRAFVLGPLVEILPHWRHPVLGCSARSLWLALPAGAQRSIAPQSGDQSHPAARIAFPERHRYKARH